MQIGWRVILLVWHALSAHVLARRAAPRCFAFVLDGYKKNATLRPRHQTSSPGPRVSTFRFLSQFIVKFSARLSTCMHICICRWCKSHTRWFFFHITHLHFRTALSRAAFLFCPPTLLSWSVFVPRCDTNETGYFAIFVFQHNVIIAWQETED